MAEKFFSKNTEKKCENYLQVEKTVVSLRILFPKQAKFSRIANQYQSHKEII